MTQKEFEDRARRLITAEDYHLVESLYMAAGNMDAELNFLRKAINKEREELAEFLIGKASAYNDTDFYSAAVKLIGQKQVTLCKIRMELPLWSEDMQYINDNLK